MKYADYRKLNDRSQNSSTYHKQDGTPVRAILKENLRKQIEDERKENLRDRRKERME